MDGGGYGGGGPIAVGLALGTLASGLYYAGAGMAAGAYHSVSSGLHHAASWIWHRGKKQKKAHTKNPRKSNWDKHSGTRSGGREKKDDNMKYSPRGRMPRREE